MKKTIGVLLSLMLIVLFLGCSASQPENSVLQYSEKPATEDGSTPAEDTVSELLSSDTPIPTIMLFQGESDSNKCQCVKLSPVDCLAVQKAIADSVLIDAWFSQDVEYTYLIRINEISFGYTTDGYFIDEINKCIFKLTQESVRELDRIFAYYFGADTQIVQEADAEPICYLFDAKYISTADAPEEAFPFNYSIISNRSELEDYIHNNNRFFDLTEFESSTVKYDDSWFSDDKLLLLVIVNHVNTSASVEVTSVASDFVVLDITTNNSPSEDKTSWHIIVESDAWYNEEVYRMYYTNNNPGVHSFGIPDNFLDEEEAEIEETENSEQYIQDHILSKFNQAN